MKFIFAPSARVSTGTTYSILKRRRNATSSSRARRTCSRAVVDARLLSAFSIVAEQSFSEHRQSLPPISVSDAAVFLHQQHISLMIFAAQERRPADKIRDHGPRRLVVMMRAEPATRRYRSTARTNARRSTAKVFVVGFLADGSRRLEARWWFRA